MFRSSLLGCILLMSTLFATSAQATNVWVNGVTYYGSPQYYSSTEGLYDIKFSYNLPWGTRVFLIYGFGGYASSGNNHQQTFEWQEEQEVEMTATAPYVWSTTIEKQLNARGQNRFLNELEFVFRIALPSGYESYDNGDISPWGFYKLNLYPIRSYVPGQEYPGEPSSMQVRSITRY